MTEIIPITRARAGGATSAAPGPESITWAPPQVYVLFTDLEETLRAVRVAKRLARAIGSGVTVIHFRSIGFGAPLEQPAGLSPVETDAFKARLEAEDCDARVRVCLCRDARQAIRSVIDGRSLVVIGGRRGWWPTPSKRWRRILEAQGYLVVFVNGTEASRVTRGPGTATDTEHIT
jgi:hypothetical protein